MHSRHSEHTPQFYYRGQQLHVIDAYTGNKVWSIMGYYTMTAVAQDKAFATNVYDGCSYAFGKGETATTVSVQNDVVAKGSTVLVKGSVLDLKLIAIEDASGKKIGGLLETDDTADRKKALEEGIRTLEDKILQLKSNNGT